jgi:hypothetical protein
MTAQQQMILRLYEDRAVDMSLPKSLRDFNRTQARKFAETLKQQARPKPPAAFARWLDVADSEEVEHG